MHCKPLLMHSKRNHFLNGFENVVRVFVIKNVLGIYLPALSKVDFGHFIVFTQDSQKWPI